MPLHWLSLPCDLLLHIVCYNFVLDSDVVLIIYTEAAIDVHNHGSHISRTCAWPCLCKWNNHEEVQDTLVDWLFVSLLFLYLLQYWLFHYSAEKLGALTIENNHNFQVTVTAYWRRRIYVMLGLSLTLITWRAFVYANVCLILVDIILTLVVASW